MGNFSCIFNFPECNKCCIVGNCLTYQLGTLGLTLKYQRESGFVNGVKELSLPYGKVEEFIKTNERKKEKKKPDANGSTADTSREKMSTGTSKIIYSHERKNKMNVSNLRGQRSNQGKWEMEN